MKHTLLCILLTVVAQQICSSCSSLAGKDNIGSLNWADSTLWYDGGRRLTTIDPNEPDVFYLLPTCLFAWNDSTGKMHYNADPKNASHRQAWKLSAELADTIFATKANFFLPYYRQSTFGTPDSITAASALNMAKRDATDAFDYYIKHINNGRPFILAGFSQGGNMVTEVLKHMNDKAYNRLIAAYVVGFSITAEDTMVQHGHKTSHIKLAKDAVSRGVTVNFNSVTAPEAISPVLGKGNIGCINPVSWTTTSTPAILLERGSTPKADDNRFPYGTAVVAKDSGCAVTVSVDALHKVLTVNGLDQARYTFKGLKDIFPEGNLHLQELFFYGDYLRENVLLRSRNTRRDNSLSIFGFKFVDLGLPSGLLWADRNVIATSPIDCGQHIAWGETEEKPLYVWQTSVLYGKEHPGNLNAQEDAATINWSTSVHMPTKSNFVELYNNCTWTPASEIDADGATVKGYKVESKNGNGNSIFLPAGGQCLRNSTDDLGKSGYYWSSSPITDAENGSAYMLYFNLEDGDIDPQATAGRYAGCTIRPVTYGR